MESVRISLTQGQFAIIDEIDAPRVLVRRWRATRGRNDSTFYARSGPHNAQIWLHRFVMSAPLDMVVDHINGDGLDNRRANLRVVTQATNMGNQRISRNNRSGFKGVRAQGGLWVAAVAGCYLGMFDTSEEAARAYDTEARKRFGPMTHLNFPEDETEVPVRVGALRRANTSGYFGVSYRKPTGNKRGAWVARFSFRGERVYLGRFPTREAAARAWDAKATEVLGISARLNFPS